MLKWALRMGALVGGALPIAAYFLAWCTLFCEVVVPFGTKYLEVRLEERRLRPAPEILGQKLPQTSCSGVFPRGTMLKLERTETRYLVTLDPLGDLDNWRFDPTAESLEVWKVLRGRDVQPFGRAAFALGLAAVIFAFAAIPRRISAGAWVACIAAAVFGIMVCLLFGLANTLIGPKLALFGFVLCGVSGSASLWLAMQRTSTPAAA